MSSFQMERYHRFTKKYVVAVREITLGGGIPIAETIVIRFLQDCSSTMRKIMFSETRTEI